MLSKFFIRMIRTRVGILILCKKKNKNYISYIFQDVRSSNKKSKAQIENRDSASLAHAFAERGQ